MKYTKYDYGGLTIKIAVPTEQEWQGGMTRALVTLVDRAKGRSIVQNNSQIDDHPYLDHLSPADIDRIERTVEKSIESVRKSEKHKHLVADAKEPLTNWNKMGLTKLGNHPDEVAA